MSAEDLARVEHALGIALERVIEIAGNAITANISRDADELGEYLGEDLQEAVKDDDVAYLIGRAVGAAVCITRARQCARAAAVGHLETSDTGLRSVAGVK